MMRCIICFFTTFFIFVSTLSAQAPALGKASTPNHSVRIKDIGSIVEARDNQIIGFGLVVGLRNTGDSRSTE